MFQGFHLNSSSYIHPSVSSGMQSHVFQDLRLRHLWRQCTVSLHLQTTRHYTPSSHFLVSKSMRKTKCSNRFSPPAESPKHRPYAPSVSRAPQDGPRPRRFFKFKWLDWARNHKLIVLLFCTFGYNIIKFSWNTQRVPIIEIWRLYYVPGLLETFFDYVDRMVEEEVDIQNSSLRSESSIMQGVNTILKDLLRVSGLDDREWEIRVVDTSGQCAI